MLRNSTIGCIEQRSRKKKAPSGKLMLCGAVSLSALVSFVVFFKSSVLIERVSSRKVLFNPLSHLLFRAPNVHGAAGVAYSSVPNDVFFLDIILVHPMPYQLNCCFFLP